MGMAKLPEIQVVTVPAVIVGGRIYLVNSNGRRIRGVNQSNLKSTISANDVVRMKWRMAVSRMDAEGYYKSKGTPTLLTPWQKKCQSIVRALKLRNRIVLPKTKRRSWDKFATNTWDDALVRMYQQGYAAFTYHSADPWRKWARTVAKNHNRKAEYRHAEKTKSSDRVGYHVHDRTPAVQMRLEWPAS